MSHTRAAREAPPEFGVLSGAVIGAHNINERLNEVIDDLCSRPNREPRTPPDPGKMTTLFMAEQIVRSHGRALILIEIIKELVALKQTL